MRVYDIIILFVWTSLIAHKSIWLFFYFWYSMASRGFILMIICKDTKPEKRTRSIRRRIMDWYLRIIRAHTCVCVYLGTSSTYIDRCVSEDFFIAFLTRLFSEIICKNYTRDTKIINYIVYSKNVYIFICVCVSVQCFFSLFFFY